MNAVFDPSTILALVALLLGGGVRDLATCISTEAYWKTKSVHVSVAQMTVELQPVAPADVSKMVSELDADDPKARETATEKLVAVGPPAVAALQEAAKTGSPEVVARAG